MSNPIVLLTIVVAALACLIVAAARGRATTAGVGAFALIGGYGVTFALAASETKEPLAVATAVVVTLVGGVVLLMAAFGPSDPSGGTDR